MTKKRLAAIDIGTNSIRCLIVEPTSNGKFRVLDDEKATVRLGEGLAQTGKISPQAWDRGIETLLRMRKIIDSYQVRGIEAVATSAVRKADNGRDFISAVARETGLAITVIGGEEEAELAAMSVRNNFEMEGIHYGMLDIGGGSLEIVTAFGGHIEQILSLDLGTVFLTEKFLHTDPVNPKEYKRLRKHIRTALREAFAEGMPPMQCLVGSGGSITSIASMVVAMGREEYESVHGYELLRSQVVHLLAMLLRKDLKGRRAVPGLHPDRADIIIAGVAVVDELMKLLDVNVLRVNERGIREGLILRGLRKHGLIAEPSAPRTWRSSVTEFARSCHFDEEHSLQVAKLAVMIFDSLAPEYGLTRRHRQILEAAAILHDTGYLISYSGHHKHSYLLIRHADLFGFTPREKEIMANAARYHRKGLPKKKHKAYDRLAAADQELVRKLGGILRLADGLDRRRNSHLRHLECSLEEGRMTIAVRDCDDVSVELFGGKMKSDLFEEAFSRKLLLRHAVQ